MREMMGRRGMRMAVAALLALLCLTGAAMAQGAAKSPFGVGPGVNAGGPAGDAARGQSPGGVQGWLMGQQKYYHDQMAGAVRGLKSANPVAAGMTLALISFVYGVLHAAGPGHGKAIISSYVLANRQTVRRGIALSFLAAFFQACSAIFLVGVIYVLIKATSLTMTSAEWSAEVISWALVTLAGVWLLVRQVVPMMAGRAAAAGHSHDDHGHDHSHGHGHGACCGHDHEQTAEHVHDENCGHVHMPEPKQLEGPWSWPRAISLAMTVGIRPCTGAIGVMAFALSQGLAWAGVVSTFVMAFGTALTVSALAALAAGSRDAAEAWAGADSAWMARVSTGAGLLGAAAVIALGAAGFLFALKGPGAF